MMHTYQRPLTGERVGVVFGSFAPLHQGHLDLIMRAKKECDGGCIVIVCGYDGDKGEPLMPHSKRYRYVREFFADDDLVAVYSINDTEQELDRYPNGWTGWLKEFNRIWHEEAHITAERRVWYVGDEAYYNDLVGLNEEVYLVDRKADNPICATDIRRNPIANWDKITFPFRRIFSTNILICGTASEGKTTLTRDLGKYFNAPYSWEWARDYMRESCVSEWELDGADYMAFLINKENKPYAVLYGTYTVSETDVTQDNSSACSQKTHCVYAGTLDPRKGGAETALNTALYLPENYHVHILGFGSEKEIQYIKDRVSKVSSNCKCSVSYDGCLSGDEYKDFISSCQIGLSTQDPDASFNATSFPSKILAYIANGLRVVTVRIPAIEKSAVAENVFFYEENTPESVAAAIKSIDLTKAYDGKDTIRTLDKKFLANLQMLLQGESDD